jgi:hypothetical protein
MDTVNLRWALRVGQEPIRRRHDPVDVTMLCRLSHEAALIAGDLQIAQSFGDTGFALLPKLDLRS